MITKIAILSIKITIILTIIRMMIIIMIVIIIVVMLLIIIHYLIITYYYLLSIITYYYSLFNRFAHSAGPGMTRHRVEWIGSGFDGLMQSSK